ncbi:MAG: Gfo/Idh/MocA family oxidoreductase [Polyangiaceae bacterium]|nr:Gfo/Idh/MocA family oxidoreductase [Polyangiaceae bacterium]
MSANRPSSGLLPDGFRWGVVGAGAWGARVADAISGLDGHALRAVYDVDLARGRGVAERHGAVVATTVEGLAAVGVDAAVVATPPASHGAVGLRLLVAGVSALVEKPLTHAAARELVQAARRTGHRVGVGHQLLHHEAIARLRALLASGALGEVRRAEAYRLAPTTRSSLDAWWELGPHDVAVVCHLLGSAPEAVRVRAQSAGASAVVAELTWRSGARAELRASYVHPTRERRLVLSTEAGPVEFCEDAAGDALTLPPGVRGISPDADAGRPLQRELCAFARAVAHGGALLGGEEDTLLAAAVLSSGAESLARGGGWRAVRRAARGALAEAEVVTPQ